ncbi:MAG: hypothetical protein M3142_03285, partial [Bacteroidota bacterium]|nr:hypothetical protein [Bacteroidota bacterium]
MDFSTFFPPHFILETNVVTLRILQPPDFHNFDPLTQDKELWRYFTKELNEPHQLKAWVEEAAAEYAAARRVPFTIIQKGTGLVCGSTSYGN